jgi:hypothetical protein
MPRTRNVAIAQAKRGAGEATNAIARASRVPGRRLTKRVTRRRRCGAVLPWGDAVVGGRSGAPPRRGASRPTSKQPTEGERLVRIVDALSGCGLVSPRSGDWWTCRLRPDCCLTRLEYGEPVPKASEIKQNGGCGSSWSDEGKLALVALEAVVHSTSAPRPLDSMKLTWLRSITSRSASPRAASRNAARKSAIWAMSSSRSGAITVVLGNGKERGCRRA